ncbi:hypothetical protein H4R34_000879 [Dimargaris verticillata]|uniref:RWD domain-containing protein n=1 Tax=Dimargaris verticillata TaxID=2761393 RepID=A0A9W8EBF7_9FUNG|nr:hypothetical protein H4R34_000879 [Dimargaris verticillata]
MALPDMSPEEQQGNAERQAEETLALQSIFGDEVVTTDHTTTGHCYQVCLPVADVGAVVDFRLYFPPGYPSRDPPVVEWQSARRTYDPTSAAIQALSPGLVETMLPVLATIPFPESLQATVQQAWSDQWEANGREVVVFQWLDWLQTYLADTAWANLPAFEQVLSNHLHKARSATTSPPEHASPPLPDSRTQPDPTLSSATLDASRLIVEHLHTAPATAFAKLALPSIVAGGRIEDRKSVFVAHAARVRSVPEAQHVVWHLLQDKRVARATHNIVAYRIQSDQHMWNQDYDDDGETAAGGRLLHLLQLLDLPNVVVVVTRWYGGVQLGPDRFKHINNSARQCLEEARWIEPKTKTTTKLGRRK